MKIVDNKTNVLTIKDLYFESFSFYNKRVLGQTELHVSYNVKYENESETGITVRLNCAIKDDDGNVTFNAVEVGIFEVDRSKFDSEITKEIFYKNTVAIMMPYMRSQISLMSSHPGVPPLILPPVDVNDIVK